MVAIYMHHMDSYAGATAAPYIANIGLTVVANLQGPCSIVRMSTKSVTTSGHGMCKIRWWVLN